MNLDLDIAVLNSLISINYSGKITNSIIYNNVGQKILSSKEKIISITKIPTGLYFILIETVDGTCTKKFIK